MFSYSSKFYAFLLLLLTCGSLINGFSKREQLNEGSESSLEAEKAEELLSTITSMIKEIDENLEEELIKEEKEELDELESKGEEVVSEANDLEKAVEEPEEKEDSKDTEKQEEKEEGKKIPTTDETSKTIDLSSTIETVPSEKEETPSSASPMLVTEFSLEKEKGPEDTFIVWNAKGKVCLLARFEVVFSITYPSKGGELKSEILVPKYATAKGKCETTTKSPILQISWQNYIFTMMFNKTEDDSWVVTSVELTYDTSDNLFDGATNAGKKTARSKPLSIFETPLEKSFYCPGQEVVLMYSGKKHVVTARMKDIYLQAYDIEDGQFSTAHRCSKVVISGPDESPYVRDETVPLAVGCTLALITLLVLLGFSFHRAYNAAKVDYNTME